MNWKSEVSGARIKILVQKNVWDSLCIGIFAVEENFPILISKNPKFYSSGSVSVPNFRLNGESGNFSTKIR